MNKRILLIGDGNSIFITRYAYWIKKSEPDYYVDIFSTTVLKNEYEHFFDYCYRIENYPDFLTINKYKGIRRILLIHIYKLFLKDIKVYDFIHFQFVSPLRFSLVNMLKKKSHAKIILSVWGSDYYKLNPIDRITFKKVCLNADAITIANPQTIRDFKSQLNWNRENVFECRFGLTPLEFIEKLNESKVECKQKLGWNPDKISIVIGYNMSEDQQHLEILRQFEHLELQKIIDKIELILPLGYGGSESYKEKIISYLSLLSCNSIVYDYYLSLEDIARVRKATDIMLQVQVKDQFSGSMQEHLFAGSLVITGDWLPYEILKEKGVVFTEISNLTQLPSCLTKLVLNYEQEKMKIRQNPNVIASLSLWQNTIESWMKLYR